MKKRLGSLMLCGAMLLVSGAVFAQDYGHDHDHGDQRYDHDHGHGDHRGHAFYDRGHREGWYRTGGRVPEEYRRGGYVVSDWHRDHLRPPPRGYHYVRSDNGDFLLVAVTTGVIASIIAGH
ncbi:RcnB family protein [Rhodanobacter sp. BL-MT-08]